VGEGVIEKTQKGPLFTGGHGMKPSRNRFSREFLFKVCHVKGDWVVGRIHFRGGVIAEFGLPKRICPGLAISPALTALGLPGAFLLSTRTVDPKKEKPKLRRLLADRR
jgi:hypothetical protein